MKLNKKRLVRGLFVIGWMLIIFYFSHQDATISSNASGKLVKIIQFFIGENYQYIDKIEFFIRKCAHMFSYFVLAILVYRYLVLIKTKTIFMTTFNISLLYACSDEFHQLFISGRSGQISDVLIDSVGICLALLFIYCFNKLFSKNN